MAKFKGTLYEGKRGGRNREWAGRSIVKVQPLEATDPGALIWVKVEGVDAADEVQTVDTDGTGGTFTLASASDVTGALAYNITKANMEIAIETLTEVTAATVTGSDGGPWIITFNDVGLGDLPMLIADDASLTGEDVGTTVVETSAGATVSNETVAFWIDGYTGTFVLHYGGQNTGNLSANINAAALITAFEGLSTIADVAVTGSGTHKDPWVVVFTDPTGNATAITADTALLTKTVYAAFRQQ